MIKNIITTLTIMFILWVYFTGLEQIMYYFNFYYPIYIMINFICVLSLVYIINKEKKVDI